MPDLPVLVVPPVAGLAFAIAALVAASIVMGLSVIRRRGRLCPRCGSTTVALVPSFPLNLLGGRVLSRWCSGCDWRGLALRPSHERRGLDGRIHLRGGFRWGTSAPPPRPFFHWSAEDEPEASREILHPPPLPFEWKDRSPPARLDGPPPPIPFTWGDTRSDASPPPPQIPFRFAGDEPPPLPFQFAEEEDEATLDLSEAEEAPRIPFRFADEDDPGRPERAPDRMRPRLGFRWKG